jgi:hypothetical protein
MQFAGERLFHRAGGAEIESRESVSRPTENPAGCERVLRVKRKGRTGFKPSGLRDELRFRTALCSEPRATRLSRRFNF